MFGCLAICSRKDCVLIAGTFFVFDSYSLTLYFHPLLSLNLSLSIYFSYSFKYFVSCCKRHTDVVWCELRTHTANFVVILFSSLLSRANKAPRKLQHQVFPIEKAVCVRDSNLIYALETQNLFTRFFLFILHFAIHFLFCLFKNWLLCFFIVCAFIALISN